VLKGVLTPGDARTDVPSALEGFAGPRVRVECDPDTGSVRMSADTFEEILGSLLDNARVHGGDGVTVTITARRMGAEVEIAVEDDGPGVSPANASRVFTPFFTTARERGGSGLGLAIVRSLLAAHGGSIRLEPGSPGARFVLGIPVG